jgi:hypothetical protein
MALQAFYWRFSPHSFIVMRRYGERINIMKTKKEKQIVVNKLRRGGMVADVQISYDTHETKRVSTPEDFMKLATGRKVDRLSWTDTHDWWDENKMQVCLLD